MKFSESAVKDAGFVIAVMKLGAENSVRSAPEAVNRAGEKHACQGRGEIDPQRRPFIRAESRSKSAGRVHTHAGKGRLNSDKRRHQRACEQRGVAAQATRVR